MFLEKLLPGLLTAHKLLNSSQVSSHNWIVTMKSRFLSHIACVNKGTSDYSNFLYNALLCIM